MNAQQEIRRSLQHLGPELEALSREIWSRPETAFQETFASRALAGWLGSRGFQIRENIAGLPTAFSASCGSGRPVIGFLGEYDALPGLGKNGGPGHGCGHNLLGVGAAGAAAALWEYLSAHGLPGTVIFFGCPAEENGAGKALMAAAGAFEGVDACFTWHPDSQTCAVGTPCLANVILRARFRGKASHAAAAPEQGRSALDACELMNVGANYLREHVPERIRFHYAYTDGGGSSPNTVPETAELQYYVRAPKIAAARETAERLHRIARGAALMTDTRLSWRVECEMLDYVPHPGLTALLDRALRDMGAPAFDGNDRASAAAFASGAPDPLDTQIQPCVFSDACRTVSSDVGNVSQIVPTAQAFVACFAEGTAFHTREMAAQAALPAAGKGMLAAAGAMALAGARLTEDPDLRKKILGK